MELAILIAFAMYFLPTIIGFMRGHASKWAIFLVNLFFGWSVIGWFIAFIWSVANKGGSQNVTVINQMSNHNGGN